MEELFSDYFYCYSWTPDVCSQFAAQPYNSAQEFLFFIAS